MNLTHKLTSKILTNRILLKKGAFDIIIYHYAWERHSLLGHVDHVKFGKIFVSKKVINIISKADEYFLSLN